MTTRPRTRALRHAFTIGALTVLPLGLLGASARLALASAQDNPRSESKDDALEDLLKEIKADKDQEKANDRSDSEKAKARSETAKSDTPTPSGKASSESKGASTADKKAEAKTGDRPASDDLAPKDKALDSLLEKLGESEDKPSPDDRRAGPGGKPSPDDRAPRPGQGPDNKKPEADTLTGKAKDLDEHLEKLTGRRRKKTQDDDANGPMSELVKQMRDVEKRLSEPDTGEETRKKEREIVKHLDQLIEQIRASSMRSQGRRQRQLAMKPGAQPGTRQDPGNTSGNAPHTPPEKPTNKHSLAGGKDAWGHLPDELRQEMENVFREEFLPAREELIRRYYESVSRNTRSQPQ